MEKTNFDQLMEDVKYLVLNYNTPFNVALWNCAVEYYPEINEFSHTDFDCYENASSTTAVLDYLRNK